MMKSPIPPLLSRRLNKDGTYNIAKQANLIFVAKTDAVLIMASTASVFSSTYQSYAMHHGIPILPDHFQISKKVGHRQPTKDCPRPVLCRCVFGICYAIERHFQGIRYKTLAASFSSTESPVNQGFFCPYYVTRARRFLMRSAACLRVIRFRQSGQYLTLLEVDAKEVPHSVQRFLSSVLKSSAYSSLSRGSTAI